MARKYRIAFVGTSRSGLGHMRRLSNMAHQVDQLAGSRVDLLLASNAQPEGLTTRDLALFAQIIVAERSDMAGALAAHEVDLAIVDTMRLPNIKKFSGQAMLVLRETPDALVDSFCRDDGASWDHVIIPNPADHWLPMTKPGFARSVTPVGWILRKTGARTAQDGSAGIVLATGGGGTPETREALYPLLDDVIACARSKLARPFVLRQALGPRAGADSLSQADEVFDPGGNLDAVFRAADLVISTAGYNSVLELATTDTPTMLAAIPRSLDDQAARVKLWGPRLGFGLSDDPEAAATWLAQQIERPVRRAPVDLGPDGTKEAARLISEMLCAVS